MAKQAGTPTATRIYRVTTASKVYLVEAITQSRAISHVAKKTMGIDVPLAKEVGRLVKDGIDIEVAGAVVEEQDDLRF
jgi:glycerol-3-phosphate dehydrogenase